MCSFQSEGSLICKQPRAAESQSLPSLRSQNRVGAGRAGRKWMGKFWKGRSCRDCVYNLPKSLADHSPMHTPGPGRKNRNKKLHLGATRTEQGNLNHCPWGETEFRVWVQPSCLPPRTKITFERNKTESRVHTQGTQRVCTLYVSDIFHNKKFKIKQKTPLNPKLFLTSTLPGLFSLLPSIAKLLKSTVPTSCLPFFIPHSSVFSQYPVAQTALAKAASDFHIPKCSGTFLSSYPQASQWHLTFLTMPNPASVSVTPLSLSFPPNSLAAPS